MQFHPGRLHVLLFMVGRVFRAYTGFEPLCIVRGNVMQLYLSIRRPTVET
jgi:hypothetical protein